MPKRHCCQPFVANVACFIVILIAFIVCLSCIIQRHKPSDSPTSLLTYHFASASVAAPSRCLPLYRPCQVFANQYQSIFPCTRCSSLWVIPTLLQRMCKTRSSCRVFVNWQNCECPLYLAIALYLRQLKPLSCLSLPPCLTGRIWPSHLAVNFPLAFAFPFAFPADVDVDCPLARSDALRVPLGGFPLCLGDSLN